MPRFHVRSTESKSGTPQTRTFELDADNWMVATDAATQRLGFGVDELGDLRCDVDGSGVISVSHSVVGLELRLVELGTPMVDSNLPWDPALVDVPEPPAALEPLHGRGSVDSQLDALLVEVRRLETSPTDEHACALALELLLRVVPAQSGSVVLIDEPTEGLRFVAATGPHRQRIVGRCMPASAGIVGMSIRGGRSVLVRMASKHPNHYALIDRELDHRTVELLAAPIRGANGVIGAIELINPIGGHSFLDWHQDATLLVAGGLGRRLAAPDATAASGHDRAR
jgi:GAF domain